MEQNRQRLSYRDWEEHSRRIPLWDPSFRQTLELLDNIHAPRWTAFCGDRRTRTDEDFIDRFARTLRSEWGFSHGPQTLLPWVEERRKDTPWFRKNLAGLPLTGSEGPRWATLPSMTRGDLAGNLENIIPETADLAGLVINPTSGTTGQVLSCPNHPRAVGCYDAFLEYILELWGLPWDLAPGKTAAVQVCYQPETLTYATVHGRHRGAGFAKVNLHPSVWPREEAQAWFDLVRPQILTGDPWSFLQMEALGLEVCPRALVSTSLGLDPELQARWESRYRCPVIDLWSSNETGPLGVTLPGRPGVFRQLAPDVLLESDQDTGELLVTGGRNPYLPLFRYRTGDKAEVLTGEEGLPTFQPRESRRLTVWAKADGTLTQPLEVARILRTYPEIQSHSLEVRSPRDLVLRLKAPSLAEEDLSRVVRRLASFWEGHLEAGKGGRGASFPSPRGEVKIQVVRE